MKNHYTLKDNIISFIIGIIIALPALIVALM